MKTSEYHRLKEGDTVVCRRIADNGDFGWAEEMDHLIDIPLMVARNENDGAVIIITEDGILYTYYYKNLQIYLHHEKVSFEVNGHEYTHVAPITIGMLHGMALENDILKFEENVLPKSTKELAVNTRTIVINLEVYNSVKRHCPRLIGVLLGHKFLVKRRLS
jgi:hypothetical protein